MTCVLDLSGSGYGLVLILMCGSPVVHVECIMKEIQTVGAQLVI